MSRRAIIAGASGLVGRRLLRLLLDDPDYGVIWALTRRTLDIEHPKLTRRTADFRHLADVPFPEADDVYCCLGTTLGKAGSQEAFREVDFSYPLDVARAALRRGARQFIAITAMGANPHSRMFYSRVKGEFEVAIAKLPYQAVLVLRPSLLAGDRSEVRPGERAAQALLVPLRLLLPRKYRPVSDTVVARAMVAGAKRGLSGFHTFESDAIQEAGG
jgi:uncharacterized protein YbjT (DUF2867 family)